MVTSAWPRPTLRLGRIVHHRHRLLLADEGTKYAKLPHPRRLECVDTLDFRHLASMVCGSRPLALETSAANVRGVGARGFWTLRPFRSPPPTQATRFLTRGLDANRHGGPLSAS